MWCIWIKFILWCIEKMILIYEMRCMYILVLECGLIVIIIVVVIMVNNFVLLFWNVSLDEVEFK